MSEHSSKEIVMAKIGRSVMLWLGLALMAGQTHAGLVTFVGEDIQPFPGAPVRTNSDAAATSFRTAASAVGPVGTITFESAPLGSFTNLTVAQGVTMNGTDEAGNAQTIRNTTDFKADPPLDGSNTTAGGSQFVEMMGGTLTFTFANPTQFFGVYLTGVQTNFFSDSITFNDGTSQTITLVGAGTSSSVGEIAFIGFVDAGKSITSITVNAGAPGPNPTTGEDFIGVDDVSFQAVPEPSSLTLGAIACASIFGFARSRRRSRP
jgi:hypothetical protein